jgi:NADH-quinone oxidoreductase subunit L
VRCGGGGGTAGDVFGVIALLPAGLIAFYMTSLIFMRFFGEKRWRNLRGVDGHEYHPHESPPVMWLPMVPLAIGSLVASYFLASGGRLWP